MKKTTKRLFALLLTAITLLAALPFGADLFLFPAAQAEETTEHIHTPGERVYEEKSAPTCTSFGHGDYVVYCTECGKELSRESSLRFPTGHQSGPNVFQSQYTKAEDGTYYMVCVKCGAIYNETDTLPEDYCKYCLSKHYLKFPQIIHNILYFFKNLFGRG